MDRGRTSTWGFWLEQLCNLNMSTHSVHGQLSAPSIGILVSYFVEKATQRELNLQFLHPKLPGDVVIALDVIGQTPKFYFIIEQTNNAFTFDLSVTPDSSRIGTVGNQSSSQGKRLRSRSRFEQCLCCGKRLQG